MKTLIVIITVLSLVGCSEIVQPTLIQMETNSLICGVYSNDFDPDQISCVPKP